MRKISLILTGLVVLLILACAGWAGPSVQQFSGDSKIDWTNNLYIAKGEGAMPSAQEEPNRARAYLKAKGYAREAAIAHLLMAIEGTAITYQASGKDYMADETIQQKIEGFVHNVEVTGESTKRVEGHTIVVVEVHAPMYGPNAPGAVFLDKALEDQSGEVEAQVKVITQPDKPAKHPANIASAQPSTPDRPYTSVIIDTTGYKVDRCMSPKIRRLDGSEVWGTVKADYDFVQDHGIVAYATTVEEAKRNSRCGVNPLMIRGIGRAGGKFYSDPVISDADAELLLVENSKSKFLDKFCVIFVKDGRL